MRRHGTLPLVAAAALLGAVYAPRASLADRGGATLEVDAGGALTNVRAPYAVNPAKAPLDTTGALAFGGEARYALTHKLELGVAGGMELPRTLYYLGAAVPDPGSSAASYVGMLKHDYSAWWAAGTVRYYLLGYDWRVFVEGRLGISHRGFTSFVQYDVSGGRAVPYPVQLPDFTKTGLLLGLGVGAQASFWDRFAVGVRPMLTLLLRGDGVAPRLGASVYLAYTWYP